MNKATKNGLDTSYLETAFEEAVLSENIPVNLFTAAVGFEILTNSITDAEHFAKDVIDSEEKEYLKMLEKYSNSY